MIIGQQNNRFLQRVNPEIARAKADGGSSNNHPEIQRLMRQMVDLGIADDLKLWVHSGLVKERVSGADVFAEKGYDISGEGNDAVQSTNADQPLITTGFDFDGSDFLSLGTNQIGPLLHGSTGVSFGFWFNPSQVANLYRIFSISINSGSTSIYSFRDSSNNRLNVIARSISTDSAKIVVSDTFFAVDTWYHFWANINYSGDSIEIFVNGASDNSGTGLGFNSSTYSQGTATRTDELGRLGDASGSEFEGNLDDFRIFSSLLTSAEITAIYNATQSNY